MFMCVFSNTHLSDSSVTIHLHGLNGVHLHHVPLCATFYGTESGAECQQTIVHNIQLKELEREININFKHLTENDDGGRRLSLREPLKVQVLTCVDIVFKCMQCVCVYVCVCACVRACV